MRRIVILAVAAALACGGSFVSVDPVAFQPAAAYAASSSTTPTATTAATTTSAPTKTDEAAAKEEEPDYNWPLIAIEGLVVIAFIALGVKAGGLGLGLWGGVGTLVLVFAFGLDPGEPPVDAILIIIAVITAAAAMEAAGGIDYMVLIASTALRARPQSINYMAPFVSYVLCILTGTSNTFIPSSRSSTRSLTRTRSAPNGR